MPPKNTKNSNKVFGESISLNLNLSQNCDKLGWRFKVYVSQLGSNDVQKAINKLKSGQDLVVLENFKARVRYLQHTPRNDWVFPKVKKLNISGKGEIYEIRFQANNVQYRPLGFFGPDSCEFTIVVWATHKQDIYDPAKAIETAESRRLEINSGEASCVPLQVNGEIFPIPKK